MLALLAFSQPGAQSAKLISFYRLMRREASFLPAHIAETTAAIIRVTGGNFRLLSRLLAQIERLLEINLLNEVTKAVVEAAHESLVVGES
jgi:DNA transposition AAA+ family ATPase